MHHLIQGCSFLCGGTFECLAIVFVPDEIQQLFNCHLIPGIVKEWVEQIVGHFLSNFAYFSHITGISWILRILLVCFSLKRTQCPTISTTPITAMVCRQCLPLSVVQLKGRHCRKPHCPNGVVDTFRPLLPPNQTNKQKRFK